MSMQFFLIFADYECLLLSAGFNGSMWKVSALALGMTPNTLFLKFFKIRGADFCEGS